MKSQACTPKMVYSTLPLYAGFFVAPDGLGANVVAALRANLFTCAAQHKPVCWDEAAHQMSDSTDEPNHTSTSRLLLGALFPAGVCGPACMPEC